MYVGGDKNNAKRATSVVTIMTSLRVSEFCYRTHTFAEKQQTYLPLLFFAVSFFTILDF